MSDVDSRLDELERVGFVVVEGALSADEVELVRTRVDHARESRDGKTASTR